MPADPIQPSPTAALTSDTARQVAALHAKRNELLLNARKAELALQKAQRDVADTAVELTKVEWAIDGIAMGQQLERDRQQAVAAAAARKGE